MKNFFTLSLTSFVFSSALWIIWYFFVVQIEGNPNWLGSLFYLPHAARVLCIVYFGWRAIPALFLAELVVPHGPERLRSAEHGDGLHGRTGDRLLATPLVQQTPGHL